jgi:hypothetical protein
MQPLALFSELQSPSFLMTVWLTLDKEYVPVIRLEPLATASLAELSKEVVVEVEGEKIKYGCRGGSEGLMYLDSQQLLSLHEWPTALLYAQPATGTYRMMRYPF